MLLKQLKSKNIKVRVQVLTTLSTLAQTIGFRLDASFENIMPELEKAADETQGFDSLLAALTIMRRYFRSKDIEKTAAFEKHNEKIVVILEKSIKHEYSKVVSAGLRATSSYLHALRTKP